ncbi:hypothetical protein [Mesorhizobium sp.]|uniref:hypothetical protein n=2 Tax=unclassified Mesorhizobium TaxID=325217 RepID=UPI000FE57AD7|nr:hypothetical protein [Mesorhizobium sp.]RWH81321.1 MAG: hypothetical protein EOQ85_09865 [Mesorhizobium sp.]RWH85706.1 MAG: hypothetical protein EOQ86_05925 [Mesorhizobium sp.]RWH90963.1 MAG: hypothetical protein EOQ87_09580 [Mesorhizobium sp.]RWH99645.1 MAG: hypothetical protein EOQ88_09685 [Mesorhizobium sp.]RWI22337.1 MAG: hypothetical protein EOQ91_08895 [Mesorhizobium sp.]
MTAVAFTVVFDLETLPQPDEVNPAGFARTLADPAKRSRFSAERAWCPVWLCLSHSSAARYVDLTVPLALQPLRPIEGSQALSAQATHHTYEFPFSLYDELIHITANPEPLDRTCRYAMPRTPEPPSLSDAAAWAFSLASQLLARR